jgi:hypothetical protein
MYRRCVTALRLLRPVNVALAIQLTQLGLGRSAITNGGDQINQTGAQLVAVTPDLR